MLVKQQRRLAYRCQAPASMKVVPQPADRSTPPAPKPGKRRLCGVEVHDRGAGPPYAERVSTSPRSLWARFESVHGVTYFAPEARFAYESAGLRGFWRGYFAGRVAPLGPLGAGPVIALFFSFAPAMVAQAVPDIWGRMAPDEALRVRRDGAVAALRKLIRSSPAADVEEAADLAWEAAGRADTAGRALAAANAGLDRPDEPLARLWQACTTLREHRGDGHVAALVAAGFTGCEVVVLRSSLDGDAERYRPYRRWDDAEWAAATTSLTERGWLDGAGVPTEAGRAVYAGVEQVTDQLAGAPWRAVGESGTARLVELLTPIVRDVQAVFPFPNPVGLRPL